jgi:hypothetical protein
LLSSVGARPAKADTGRKTAHLPCQAAASLTGRLAHTVLDLDRHLTDLDREVDGIFRTHEDAAVITSLTSIAARRGVLGRRRRSSTG